MLSAKISKEYVNGGISSQLIDTSGPSTDPYRLNVNFDVRILFHQVGIVSLSLI